MRRILKFLLWAVVTLAVLGTASLVGARLLAPGRQEAANRAWAESFEPMEALRDRFSNTTDSPAAIKLASLTEPLGISLRASSSSRTEMATFQPLAQFVADQTRKADDEVLEPAPALVTQLLSNKAADIEAIETHLLAADPIVWQTDIQKGLDAPVAPWQGLRYLGSVLLARAIESARTGQPRAAQSLLASLKLNHAMRERPELIGQLVAMAMSSVHNGVVRRLPAGAIETAGAPSDHDWTGAVLRSFQVDTLQFSISVRASGVFSSNRRVAFPSGPVSRASVLWIDLSLADYSRHMGRMAVELRPQDPCALDTEAFSRRVTDAIPWWNRLSPMAMPGLVRSWESAGRAAVDDELTRLIVQAKLHLRTRQPSAALPPAVPSTVCEGLSYGFSTLPNGDVQVAANRNPFRHAPATRSLSFRAHRGTARVK